MRFHLGTHMPNWLGLTDVPLFVSHRRLADRRTFPRALGPWALDSGGFTELSMFGGWQTTPDAYATAVRRYSEEVGGMEWCAPMDWMCEPFMLAKTGLSVAAHQQRTVASVLDLRERGLPVIPVLQGWEPDDYRRCADLYDRAGIDLTAEPVVGLGSVCRRQADREIAHLVHDLSASGIRCHGFGVKTKALGAIWPHLASADSLAWSYNARRNPPLPGCTHKSCANCLRWALRWRDRVLVQMRHYQADLWEVAS